MTRQSVTNARPTEKITGLAGAVAALIAWFFKIDEPGVVASLMIVLGAVPSGVTWVVETFFIKRK